jgi:hypothetical protein
MNIEKLIEKIKNERPEKWEDLPDFMIYKDQLISYMEKQHIGFSEGESLTSAMINNYTKSGLLPRAIGKKYGKEHIASLTMTSLLKQVLQSDDVIRLVENYQQDEIEETYNKYLVLLDEELNNTIENIKTKKSSDKYDMAMRLAISSYINKLLCQKIIEETLE